MNAQNRDQPGMEMVENEYANFAPPEQSTTRVRNNEKLETMIRETNKSVQSNRKLMWLSLIFLLLIFTGGFVALHFSISAKVEMETRRALQTTLLKQINTSTEVIQSTEKSLTMWKGQLERNLSSVSSDLETLKQQHTNHQSLPFVDILSNSASSIFPGSLPNYFKFKYDGSTNYSIGDGGNDMYDVGNKLQVWRNNETPVQVIYDRTYSDPLGNFLMVCKARHPFVLSMLVLNRDGESRTYYIKEYGDLGADGSGRYMWNTGSLLVGSYNIHYLLFQVYGAGDPSIIQIFFTVSSPKLGSTGSSSIYYVDSERNTFYTDHTVYISGTAHNVYFNYILTSKNPSSYVTTSTIEAILRQTFQNFSA